MNLSGPMPRMLEEATLKVHHCLSAGCHCGGETATLRQRKIQANVCIHLQCDNCGRSISGSLKRAEHLFWQSYPFWDDVLAEHGWKNGAPDKEAIDNAWKKTREEYRNIFLSSPEWKKMRELVLQRDRWLCQACLSRRATDVHHNGGYVQGLLPPAWKLKAVCRECHDKLHGAPRIFNAIAVAAE